MLIFKAISVFLTSNFYLFVGINKAVNMTALLTNLREGIYFTNIIFLVIE